MSANTVREMLSRAYPLPTAVDSVLRGRFLNPIPGTVTGLVSRFIRYCDTEGAFGPNVVTTRKIIINVYGVVCSMLRKAETFSFLKEN